MSNERGIHGDVTRVVRSWLREDRHEDADRVLVTALNAVDTTPQRRTTRWSAWRDLSMDNNVVRVGLVAAAAVIIAVIAINLLPGSPAPGGEPSSSPEPTAASVSTATPVPADAMSGGLVTPGTYTLYDYEGRGFDVTMTVEAEGWAWQGWLVNKHLGSPPDGTSIQFWPDRQLDVYADPCNWSDSPPTPATTVDELVAAMAAQTMREATTPVDITVGGYPGKAMEVSVPLDIEFVDCHQQQFQSWDGRYHQAPGQHDLLWIIDVDGELFVIDSFVYDATTAADAAERQAILDSITISR